MPEDEGEGFWDLDLIEEIKDRLKEQSRESKITAGGLSVISLLTIWIAILEVRKQVLKHRK